jgi:DNA-binding response OmpR family regulator
MERHILLVEDTPDLNNLFNRVISAQGYRVTPVTTLVNARAMIAHLRFDLLVLDMRLPDGDGINLLEETWPTLESLGTKVIVVTAQDQYRKACEALGVEYFLVKPVSTTMLRSLVTRLIGGPLPPVLAT